MPLTTELSAELIVKIIELPAKWSGDKLQRHYKVLKLLKHLNLGELQKDFASIYAHTLVEYTVDAHYRYLALIFDLKNIKTAFRDNLYKNDPQQKELAEIMYRESRTNTKLECLIDVFKSADDFKPEIKRFADLFDYFTLQTANPFQLKKYNEDRDFQAKMLEEAERKSFAYQIERYLIRLRDDFKKDFLDKNYYIDLDGETRLLKRDKELRTGAERKMERMRTPGPVDFDDEQIGGAMMEDEAGGEKYEIILHSPLDGFINEWLADDGSNLLVIIGEYGTGKTTFLRHAAHRLASNRIEPGKRITIADRKNRIPLFFPLRYFEKNIEPFIVNRFNTEGITDIDPAGFLRRIEQDELLIMLDGFDEMTQKIDADEKGKNFAKIRSIIESSPRSKIILTTRQEYFQSGEDFENVFKHRDKRNYRFIHLRPFSDEQIRLYLKAHTDDPGLYWEQIKKIFDLHDLAKRPVLLQLIVDHLPGLIKEKLLARIPHPPAPSPRGEGEKNIDIKIKSVDLYERCIQDELSRKSKELDFIVPGKYRLEILQKLAVWMFLNEAMGFDTRQLEGELNLRQYFKTERAWEYEKYLNEFLTFTFLIREGDYRFRISHKSFRDYLAACAFVQEINTNKIENFGRARTTKEIEHFLLELEPRKEALLDLLSNSRDLPEEKEWQGSNAASILLKRDRTILRGRNLEKCRLRRVGFWNCDLTGTDFRGADLSECLFDKSILSARLEGVQVERSLLELGGTGISDLSPLRELRQLTFLNLSNNKISNLAPLRELRQLTVLFLNNNRISDTDPLRELGQMRKLRLSSNQISDLGSLKELRNLTELNLYNNQITDLGPLRELGQLTYLDLSGNQISDLSPLLGLAQLKEIKLKGNPLAKKQIEALKKAMPEVVIRH